MQFWPRKRAKRAYSRIRTFTQSRESRVLGFAGYKAGMTHAIVTDNRRYSPSKGESISMPVTIIECPPLRVAGYHIYKTGYDGLRIAGEVLAEKQEKNLSRKIKLPKQAKAKPEEKDIAAVRLLVHTQPNLAGIRKKKPELFELALSGSPEEQLAFAGEKLGKDILVDEVLSEGQQIDTHGVTKGKGFQGPVKRFGVSIRAKKSEKTKRGPGNVGPWGGNRSWTVAHAGQTGYQNRFEKNKLLLKIVKKAEEVNPKGGFINYGLVKSTAMLLKGSVSGPKKRLIMLTFAQRPNRRISGEAPAIESISTSSKQGR